MTKEAIAKLSKKQVKYCETMSAVIAIDADNVAFKKCGAVGQYERDTGKLRGYLECLCQMGIITAKEMQALYLWYFTEGRKRGAAKDTR